MKIDSCYGAALKKTIFIMCGFNYQIHSSSELCEFTKDLGLYLHSSNNCSAADTPSDSRVVEDGSNLISCKYSFSCQHYFSCVS